MINNSLLTRLATLVVEQKFISAGKHKRKRSSDAVNESENGKKSNQIPEIQAAQTSAAATPREPIDMFEDIFQDTGKYVPVGALTEDEKKIAIEKENAKEQLVNLSVIEASKDDNLTAAIIFDDEDEDDSNVQKGVSIKAISVHTNTEDESSISKSTLPKGFFSSLRVKSSLEVLNGKKIRLINILKCILHTNLR